MREIKRIVVHCTATAQSATIESIKAHWRNVLKWRGMGYHYIVEPSGIVAQIESERNIVNGVRGFNADSIHVAYIGGVDGSTAIDNRTPGQRKSLSDLISNLATKYPDAQILGHRDLSPDLDGDGCVEPHEWIKQCPCFNAKEEYDN